MYNSHSLKCTFCVMWTPQESKRGVLTGSLSVFFNPLFHIVVNRVSYDGDITIKVGGTCGLIRPLWTYTSLNFTTLILFIVFLNYCFLQNVILPYHNHLPFNTYFNFLLYLSHARELRK